MYYYQYDFVSAESIYARIKEELKSYFDTGAVDDVMFPLWTDDCLRKLTKATQRIRQGMLFLDDFQAKLPPDFKSVREAWVISDMLPKTVRIPGSYYTQITTRVGVTTNDPASVDSCVPCDSCTPDMVSIVYKTNTEQTHSTRVKYFLVPGTVASKERCSPDFIDHEVLVSHGIIKQEFNTFDIHGNKFTTQFRQGDVLLVYYADAIDGEGTTMVPDNFRIQDYIRKYLAYKVFVQLWNQITDETFMQVEKKMQYYKQESDEAFILADVEVKKKTIYEKARDIYRDRHRLDKYRIR